MTDKFMGRLKMPQWINDFEKDCERCLIEEYRKKTEFFSEKSSVDW